MKLYRNWKNEKRYLIALILIALSVFTLQAQSSADELFAGGRDAFSSKSYSSAVDTFDQFLETYPEDPRADGVNYMRSVSYFYMRKYLDSIKAFELFDSVYSDSAYKSRVSYWLGLCNYALKNYGEAAKHFLEQTTFRNESFFVSRSYLYLGESYEKASEPEQAMEAYRQGIIAGGEEKIISQNRLKLGILYFNDGDFVAAREQFSEILNNSIDTNLVSDSQFYFGECLYYLGDLTDAASKLQFYLFMNSNNKYREAAVFRLGDIYQSLGKTDEAVKYLQLLIGDYPDGRYYLDGLRVLGRTWKDVGDMARASAVYEEIISLSDDEFEIQSYYFELAMTKLDSESPIDAEPLLVKVTEGPDRDLKEMGLFYLGQILINTERSDDGAIYLNTLVSEFPGTDAADDASITLAEYLIGKGDKHRLALFIGSQLSRVSKYLDRFLFIKGGLDEEENNLEEAVMAYDRIIDEFPDSEYLARALHKKAEIFISQERFEEAVPLLDLALREAESDKERNDVLVDKALLLYDMGLLEEADYAFTILLEQDIDFERKDEVLYRQGELSMEARNYDEAAEFFRRSAEAAVGDRSIDALFNMGKSYFHMLNFKTSERIYTDLADKLSATPDRKTEAMRMTAKSIFLQQDWTRTLQFSDLMVTSLGIYPLEIRLLKLLSLLALDRKDAFARELEGLQSDSSDSLLIYDSMTQLEKTDIASVLLIFRSLLGAYPDESATLLTTLLMTDLLYIVSDDQWISETYELVAPHIEDDVLAIGFKQAYEMNQSE